MSMVDAEKWTLDCIQGLHFWRRYAGFGVLVSLSVLRLAGACLFACNAAALDDGFSEGRNGNCQDI